MDHCSSTCFSHSLTRISSLFCGASAIQPQEHELANATVAELPVPTMTGAVL